MTARPAGMRSGMRSDSGMRSGMSTASAMGARGGEGSIEPAGSGADRAGVLITRYRRILNDDPRETFAFQRLLNLYRERDGDTSALVRELETEVAADADAYAPRMLLGHLYKAQARLQDAGSLYARAAELEPREPAPHLGVAGIARAQGAVAEARAAFERALDLTRDDTARTELIRDLAGLALDAADYDGARAYYDRIGGRGATLYVRTELARALSERGDYDRAITEYQRVLGGLRGDNRVVGPVLRDLARAQLDGGHADDAIATLDRALRSLGRDSGVRREIYDVMVEAYRRSDRLPELAAQLEGRGRDFDAVELLGRIYDELGNDEQALATYRKALRLNGRDIDTRVRIVQLLSRSGRLDDVVEEYRALVRAAPREPRFVVELAQLLMQTGKRDEALRLAEQTSRQHARDAGVHQALAELYTRWGESEKASREIAALVRIDPRDPGHLIALGEQQLDEGRPEAAMATWNRLLSVDGDKARAHATLAAVLADHDFLDESEHHYRAAVEADVDGEEYLRGLAAVLERPRRSENAADRRRRDEEAARWWQKVLDSTEDRPARREARRRIVAIWSRRGELNAKREQWQRAFNVESSPDVEAGRFLAEAYLRARPSDPARAETVLDRIARLEPGDVETLLALERVQAGRGDLSAAIETLRRLVSADPHRAPRYLQRMAEHAHALYHDEDAVRFAAEAVSRTPEDAEGHRRLGDLLRARQDLEGAIRSYRKALALDERLFSTYFDLAELHLARSEHDEADRLYRRVLGLAPDDDLVGRAGRASLQIHLGAGSLEVLEADLLPLALAHPRRPIFRKVAVELYDSLTAGWIQQASDGSEEAEEKLARLGHRALKPLLEALADPDPAQRRVAVDVLGHLGNANAAEPLLAMALGDAPIELRIRAVEGVGRVGEGNLSPRLATLAKGSERRLRPIAAWALAQVGGPSAIAALRELLAQGDPAVRAHAALGLGRQRDGRSAEALLTSLRTERSPAVQAASVWAIGQLGDEQVVPILAALLGNASFLVARGAAIALGQLAARGHSAGREALTDALFDPRPELRDAAAAALAASSDTMTREGSNRSHAQDDASRRSPVGVSIDAYLGHLFSRPQNAGWVDLQPLLDGLERSARSALHGPVERLTAALAVLEPDASSTPAGLGPLTRDLAEWPAEAREAALQSLTVLAERLAPDFLGLATHPSAEIRAAALALVGRMDDSAAAATALAGAIADSEPKVRQAALNAVSARHAGHAELLRAVVDGARQDDWATRLRAVDALRRTRAQAAEAALVERLGTDDYAFVREAAALALGSLPQISTSARAALQTAASSDTESRVRAAASRATSR